MRPEYPPSAQQKGIDGTVFLEATITTTGCVAEARVTRGVSSALDFAALRAVTRWRFEPTLLDGRPVDVIMTVTVNFKLQ